MANYQIISVSEFSKLRWRGYENYNFASKDIVVSLSYEELPAVCVSMPILFLKDAQNYTPVALLGLRRGKNLFVSKDGKWLSNYVPAQFRAYPFAVANIGDDRLALCIDRDSGLVGENFENPFFEDSGQPTSKISEVMTFLTQLWQSKLKTIDICRAIDELGLIVPWKIKVVDQQGEQILEGLHRVDEEKLRELDAQTLHRLFTNGALDVIYCHLISLQNINNLKSLAEAQAKEESNAPLGEIDLSFLDQGGSIRFH